VADSKKYLKARLSLWEKGDLTALLSEARCIQAHLPTRPRSKAASKSTSKVNENTFAKMVYNDRVGTATRYLSSGGGGGVLSMDDVVGSGVDQRSVAEVLREKHPKPQPLVPTALLEDEYEPPDPVMYEALTPALIRRVTHRVSGSAGPSGLDAVAWQRMITAFKGASDSLAAALASAAKCLCTKAMDAMHLQAFLAARLIPLDKNPGVRPIAVGEVFRRIVGKAIMSVIERDVVKATAPIQLCVGIPAACEVAISSLVRQYSSEDVDGILLVDASNAFNSLNRATALHNIPKVCPAAGQAFINMYQADIPLFVDGGDVIWSREGTCQGDPPNNGMLTTMRLSARLSPCEATGTRSPTVDPIMGTTRTPPRPCS